jgi:hypothetical protein
VTKAAELDSNCSVDYYVANITPYKVVRHRLSGMFTRIVADFVVIIHFGFIVFVVLGGLLVFRWPKFM